MNKKLALLSAFIVCFTTPAFAAGEESGAIFLGELSSNKNKAETPDVLNYVITRQKEGSLPGLTTVPPQKKAPPPPRTTTSSTPAPQDTSHLPRSEFWQWPITGRVKEMFSEIGNTKGIGIYGEKGQKVAASKSGNVIYVGTLSSFGRLVIIENDNDEHYVSTYANLENILVRAGDHISQGDTLATLGTDRENQPILYFAINYYGKPVDPLRYLPPHMNN